MKELSAPLRAFVAMKIGEPETDRFFEEGLSPVLREVGLTAIRIDRVEFNDDIDDRIIEEIRRSDLVIADLTFARPSVYFEGGFAAGLGKPVIYTARRDHLHPRDSDRLGNFRVHFDLQMKNIITWSEPDSSSFQRLFRRRVRHVIAPLIRNRLEDAAATEARREFSSLPLAERLESIADMVRTSLEAEGYQLEDLSAGGEFRYRRASALAPQMAPRFKRVPDSLFTRGFVGVRKSSATIDAVWVRIEQTLPLTILTPMNTLLEFAPPHDMNPPRGVRPNRVVEHILLCSLQAVPASRMHTAFPSFKQLGRNQLVASFRHQVPTTRIGEYAFLIGRLPYGGGMWHAIAFEPDKNGVGSSWGKEYDIKGGVMQRNVPGIVTVFPPTSRKHPPNVEILGRTKDVARYVSVHLIDGVDSVPALRADLASVRERFNQRSETLT